MLRTFIKQMCLATVLASCVTPEPAAPRFRWVRANFHSHMNSPHYEFDDGRRVPLEAYRRYEELGFEFNLHSAHTRAHKDYAKANRQWHELRKHEAALPLKIHRLLGCEVNVARGPKTEVLQRNLNHVNAAGITNVIPSGMPLRTTLDWIHGMGGIAIINHPGPPHFMHWEKAYWEREETRYRIDAIEAYNGNSMIGGVHFEKRYLEATHDLGMKIAAVTGCDTHGRRYERWLAMTYVLAESAEPEHVLDAVRGRRTIATYGLMDLKPECRNIGRVIHGSKADLFLGLGRIMESIKLRANGKTIATWKNASKAEYRGAVTEDTAFVWTFRSGGVRGITSAIWYEKPVSRADLTFEHHSPLRVVNRGKAPSGPFTIRAGAKSLRMKSLAPGESREVNLDVGGRTVLDIDAAGESEQRNNSFFLPGAFW